MLCSEKLNKKQTDFSGNTAVHLAVLYGFYSIAELLLKNNFSTDIPNKVNNKLWTNVLDVEFFILFFSAR